MDNARKVLGIFAENGVCETGKRWLRMQDMSMDTLIHVTKRWPEYYVEHYDFAVECLRSVLDEEEKAELSKENIFIDRKLDFQQCIFPESPIYLFGDSEISMSFGAFGTARFYCFGNSKLKVSGDLTAMVTIDLYGDSHLVVEGDFSPTVWMYDNSTVNGDAKIIKKDIERGSVFNGEEMGNSDMSNW